MRYDMTILWIDDTPSWQNEAKEIIEMKIADLGISCNLVCVEDVQEVFKKIKQEKDGFILYDLLLIDYSLSDTVTGNQVIKELRGIKIDADVIFYSSDRLSEIQEIIKKDGGSFEGVYTTDRNAFIEKCMSLIQKNSRRLLSLSNIRGFLMDHTSENDYIVNSCILNLCSDLKEEQKSDILLMIKEVYQKSKKTTESKMKQIEKLLMKDPADLSIKKFFELPSYVFSVELKYRIFSEIIKFKNINISFGNDFPTEYNNLIVKKRNTIAHKKLDVCKLQKYIKYCDNSTQYMSRKCPIDCGEHIDENSISLTEWEEIRKKTISYGNIFNDVAKELLK